MIEQFIELIKKDKENFSNLQNSFEEIEIPSKTILLHDGEISRHMYIVKKGCLRQWFNKDGKDITLQFFFENQPVASIDSFLNNQPSLFTIESIEPSRIISIRK